METIREINFQIKDSQLESIRNIVTEAMDTAKRIEGLLLNIDERLEADRRANVLFASSCLDDSKLAKGIHFV